MTRISNLFIIIYYIYEYHNNTNYEVFKKTKSN
nr:MAG TPA: hypothetical protein [Caudoviricetes sp.]